MEFSGMHLYVFGLLAASNYLSLENLKYLPYLHIEIIDIGRMYVVILRVARRRYEYAPARACQYRSAQEYHHRWLRNFRGSHEGSIGRAPGYRFAVFIEKSRQVYEIIHA